MAGKLRALLLNIFILILIGATPVLAGEEADIKISGAVTGSETDLVRPVQYLFDDDPATGWGFQPGVTEGWAELTLEEAALIDGIKLSGDLAAGTTLYIEYDRDGRWIPFIASALDMLPNDGLLDLSLDRAVTSKLRLRLEGAGVAGTSFSDLIVLGECAATVFHKIQPEAISHSANTSPYYAADYLTDGNTYTRWGTKPSSNQGAVLFKLDDLYTLNNINLYFTDTSNGEIRIEIPWEDGWRRVGTIAEQAEGWYRLALEGEALVTDQVKLVVDGYGELGGIGEVEIWGYGAYQGRGYNPVGIQRPRPVTEPVNLRFEALNSSGESSPDLVQGSVQVLYQCANTAENSSSLQHMVRIVNTGPTVIDLADLKARYWFTDETKRPEIVNVYWTSVGKENLTTEVVKYNQSHPEADTYLEIGFKAGAGKLLPGAYAEVQLGINTEKWDIYNQKNDYSFSPSAGGFCENQKYTAYVQGNLAFGTEPVGSASMGDGEKENLFGATKEPQPQGPTPRSSAYGSLKVEYKNNTQAETANSLQHDLKLVNVGQEIIDLSKVRLRYWFTKEPTAEQRANIYWASIGTNKVTARFIELSTDSAGSSAEDPGKEPGADHYLELGFTGGTLAPGAEAEIKLGFNTVNWANYYQLNDYTYNNGALDYEENIRYTAYYDTKLIWGIEPAGSIKGASQDHELLLAFADLSNEPVSLELNGRRFTVDPYIALRGNTLYQLTLPAENLYAGENYLRIHPGTTPRKLVNALVAGERRDGVRETVGGPTPLTDGLLLTTANPASGIIDLKEKTLLEEVTVRTSDYDNIKLYTWIEEKWEPIYPTKILPHKVIFKDHLTTDKLRLESTGRACELILLGSPITDRAPGVKITWPAEGEELDLAGWGEKELKGFLDNPQAKVSVNGVRAEQKGHTFSIRLNRVGLRPWETITITATAQDEKKREGSDRIELTLGKLKDCSIDQPDILAYTDKATFRISGKVKQSFYQVKVNDQEIAVKDKRYQTEVTLKTGLNLIKIEFVDSRSGFAHTYYRRVVRRENRIFLWVDSPRPGTYINKDTVRVSGMVEGWGNIAVTVNGESATVGNYGFLSAPVTLDNEENTITVRAEDEQGNAVTKTLTLYCDRTAPVLSGVLPVNDSIINTSTAAVTGKISDTGPVVIFVNGQAATQEDGVFKTQISLEDGTHRIGIKAEDLAGNVAVYYINVMVDTTPPAAFAVTADPEGWTNNNQPVLTFGTVDATSGIDHYELSIDDGEFMKVASPHKLEPQPDGAQNVTIKAVDKAGWETFATTKIYIDTTPPSVPEGFEAIPGINRVFLKWQGENPQGEIVGYRIKRLPAFPEGEYKELTRASDTDDLSRYLDEEVISGVSYTYALQARDRAGNYSRLTEEHTVTVEAVTQNIDSDGGVIKFDACELIIPAEAISDPGRVVIKEADTTLPDNIYATKMYPAYSITVLDQAGREVETEFDELVTLKINYADLEIPEGFTRDNLGIYWYNRSGGYWEKLDYAFNNFVEQTISVKLEHFSEYQVMASNYAAPSLDSYYNMGVSPFQAYFQNNAESVSPLSGSLSLNASDLSVPGRSGFGVLVQRIYDSKSAEHEKMIAANDETYRSVPVDTFGYGWSLNIPWIEQTNKGKFIRLPEGQTIKIKLNSKNVFEYHEGVHFIMEGTSKLTMSNGTQYEFDGAGKVTRRLDPGGVNEVRYEYNGRELSRITDSVGHVIEFSYTNTNAGSQRVINKITAGGRSVYYRYDSSGYLTEVGDPLERKTTYAYETHTFRSGVYSSIEGDDSFNYTVKLLNSITYPTGERSLYTYELRDQYYSEKIDNKLFGITIGHVRIRYYGTKALIKKHTVAGKETTYSYQMNNRTGSFARENFIPAHTYMQSSAISEGERINQLTLRQIEGRNLVNTPSDSEKYKGPLVIENKILIGDNQEVEEVLYEYNIPLRAVTEENHYRGTSLAYRVTNRYDRWGNLTTRMDGSRNLEETRTYYKQGALPFKNLVATKTVKNHNPLTDTFTTVTTSYSYDETLGKPITVNVSDGFKAKVTRLTYDSYGNLKTRIDEYNDNLKTELFYDDTNTFPLKQIVYGVCNADGELEDIITETSYDWQTGLKQWEKDALGFITEYQYDKLNRIIKIALPDDDRDGTDNPYREYVFDDENNICDYYNEKGQKTTYRFDGLGRLTEVIKHTALYDGQIKTAYHYNGSGQIDRVTDALGNTTVYEYDGLNRVTKVTYPGGAYVTLQYIDSTNTVIITDENGGIVSEQKDWAGRLIQSQQYLSFGENMESVYTWQFSYDSFGNTLRQTDPKASRTDQEYNAFGRLISIKLPEVAVILPGTFTTVNHRPTLRYEYDLAGFKTAEISPNENAKGSTNKVKHEFDQLGRAIKTITQAKEVFTGEMITMVTRNYYDETGRIVKTIDPKGEVWEYSYSARGWLLSEKDPEGNTTRYQYDTLGNKIATTDPRGNGTDDTFTTWYVYDDLNRLTKTIFPDQTPENRNDNPYMEITYDKIGNQITTHDPNRVVTSYSYTVRNWLETVSVNGELKTKYVYDAKGNQLEIHDAVGNITKKDYDSLGRVRKLTQLGKDQTSRTYHYDEVGNPVAVRDGRNNTTEYTYNRLNWLTGVKDPLNHVTQYIYDPNGNQVQVITPKKLVLKMRYDELNRLVEKIDSVNNSIKYSYDLTGNRQKALDRRGTSWVYRYYPNNLLRRLDLTGADGTGYYVEYDYDAASNLMKVTDSGNTVKYNHQGGTYQADPLNRLNSVDRSFDGATYRTAYQYDQAGLLTKIKYPEATEWIKYNYNGLNQLSEVEGFTAENGIAYEANGALKSITFANGVNAEYNYDSHNRLEDYQVTLNGSDILRQHFTYDGNSNITELREGTKVKTYEYDATNQLTRAHTPGTFLEKEATAGRAGYKTHDYFGLSGLNFEEAPTAVISLDYTSSSIGLDFGTLVPMIKKILLKPDKEHQTHRVTAGTFDLFTSEDNMTYSIVPRERWEFQKSGDGTVIITMKETISARYLKIHAIFDDRDSEFVPVNKASFLNELAKMLQVYQEADSRTESYQYDADGNRVNTQLKMVQIFNYQSRYYAASNRLLTDGKQAFKYDKAGNLIAKGNKYTINGEEVTFSTTGEGVEYWTYRYDLLNRLLAVTKNGTIVAEYAYDPEGMRVVKKAKGETVHYVFEGTEPIFEKKVTSGERKSYVYAFGRYLARVDGVISGANDKVYYYHTDHFGSIRAVTDESGEVVYRADYLAFGKRFGETTGKDFDEWHGFTGKEYDPETGLYYYNARWYDADIGRFISEDPAADPNNPNLYSYCGNNPIVYTDPTGRWFFLMPIISGVISEVSGGDFLTGFFTGCITGGISLGVESLLSNTVVAGVLGGAESFAFQAVSSGLSGGLTSMAFGGDFWAGAGQAVLAAGITRGLENKFGDFGGDGWVDEAIKEGLNKGAASYLEALAKGRENSSYFIDGFKQGFIGSATKSFTKGTEDFFFERLKSSNTWYNRALVAGLSEGITTILVYGGKFRDGFWNEFNSSAAKSLEGGIVGNLETNNWFDRAIGEGTAYTITQVVFKRIIGGGRINSYETLKFGVRRSVFKSMGEGVAKDLKEFSERNIFTEALVDGLKGGITKAYHDFSRDKFLKDFGDAFLDSDGLNDWAKKWGKEQWDNFQDWAKALL